MMRTAFRWSMQFVRAACLLVLLCCAGEVAVRIAEWRAPVVPQSTTSTMPGSAALVPSSRSYEELLPGRVPVETGPDGKSTRFLTINSLGGRGPEPAIPRPPATYRVVWLGDETIFAGHCADELTPPGLLRQWLQSQTGQPVEVWNAGLPGGCPLTAALQFRQNWLAARPDLVLVHVDLEDMTDDLRMRRFVQLDADRRPVSCRHPSLRPTFGAKARRPLWRSLRLTELAVESLCQSWLDRTDGPPDREAVREWWERGRHAGFEPAMQPLIHLKALCDDLRVPLIVVTSPKPWQLSSTAGGGPRARERAGLPADAWFRGHLPNERLAEFARANSLTLLDTRPLYAEGPAADAAFLKRQPYLSLAGQKTMVRALGELIVRSTPGPWRPTGSPGRSNIQQAAHRSILRYP